jgi:DNA-binding CsgD family transcriptional regulator
MMEVLPNTAEVALADAIRLAGGLGFEASLTRFLRRSIACNNVVFIVYRRSATPVILYSQADDPIVFRDLFRVYVPGAYLLDPYHDLHLNRIAPGAYRLLDIAPDQFQRSQYYLDYYRQTTLIDELTFVSYPADDTTLNICLGRDASTPRPFGTVAREIAVRIAPVVAALADRHLREFGAMPSAGTGPPPPPTDEPVDRLRRVLAANHAIRLSQRQAQVSLLILQGHSSVSIGLRLGVSAQTVKVFRRQIYARCGISSQAELFALLLPLLIGEDV